MTSPDRKPFFTDSDVSEIFSLPMVNLDLANAKVADLVEENARLREALEEIAMYGLTRPLEMGEGDDGDEHYKRIAMKLISKAARARTALAETEKIEDGK